MIETAKRRWVGLDREVWLPVAPLLALQLLSGFWYLPQLSFFPIYLDERLGLLPVVIAVFVSAGQLAGMVSGLVGGVWSDLLGSKWVLVLGLICAAVSSLVFQTTLPAMIGLLWILSGFALGFHTLGGQSYVTRVADPRNLGLVAAVYALCLTLGGAAGSPVAGRVLDARGFSAYGWLVLGLIMVTLAVAVFLLPSIPVERSGERRTARETWAGAAELVQRPTVLMLIALRFLPTILYGMMGVLIPLLINRLTGSKSTVALYASVSLVVASTAQLFAGRAADRFGRRLPALIGFGTLIAAAFGLAATATTLAGLFLFGVMGIAAAWALAALMFCLVSDGVARAEQGRVFGLLHGSWSVAMIAGSMLGGILVRVGPGLPFLVGGLINVASIFLVLAYLARVKAEAPVTLSPAEIASADARPQ
jgi:MFS family permease